MDWKSSYGTGARRSSATARAGLSADRRLYCYLCQGGYVFVHVCLFVCWEFYAKNRLPNVSEFDGKVAHEPRGGNPEHVRLGFRLGGRVVLRRIESSPRRQYHWV